MCFYNRLIFSEQQYDRQNQNNSRDGTEWLIILKSSEFLQWWWWLLEIFTMMMRRKIFNKHVLSERWTCKQSLQPNASHATSIFMEFHYCLLHFILSRQAVFERRKQNVQTVRRPRDDLLPTQILILNFFFQLENVLRSCAWKSNFVSSIDVFFFVEFFGLIFLCSRVLSTINLLAVVRYELKK